MVDTPIPITQLPGATYPLAGSEPVALVQAGETRQAVVSAISAAGAKTLTNITALRALNVTAASYGTFVNVTYNWNANDGGGSFYLHPTDTTSADNGGTVIVDAHGNRWYRLMYDGTVSIESFGGGTGVANNTTALNLYNTALMAGVNTPYHLKFRGAGVYYFTTLPNTFLDVGASIWISGQGTVTVIARTWTSANETEAVFHGRGNTQMHVEDLMFGNTAGEGGSHVRYSSTSTNAAGFVHVNRCYMTRFTANVVKSISSVTNANPGVFTINAHGYVNNDVVVAFFFGGSGWWNKLYRQWKISDATANTFTLTDWETGVKLDTSTFGALSSGTVARRLGPDCNVSIDGTEKTAAPIGVRGVKISNCNLFGQGQGAIIVKGAVDYSFPGTTISGGGLNGAIYATGTAGVNSFYGIFDGATCDGVREDYSTYLEIVGLNQGYHLRTANTVRSQPLGIIAGQLTAQTGYNSGAGATFGLLNLPGKQLLQWKQVTGVNGVYAGFTWPQPFGATPTLFGAIPINSGSAAPTASAASPGVNGVNVAGTNLSAGGDVIIWAIGDQT